MFQVIASIKADREIKTTERKKERPSAKDAKNHTRKKERTHTSLRITSICLKAEALSSLKDRLREFCEEEAALGEKVMAAISEAWRALRPKVWGIE